MSRKQSNVPAVIIWGIGLLGFLGIIHPLGFIPLIIPVGFVLLGNKFTHSHALSYLNVLITTLIIYFLLYGIDRVFDLFKVQFSVPYLTIGSIYFGFMSIFGLLRAINHRKMIKDLVVKVF